MKSKMRFVIGIIVEIIAIICILMYFNTTGTLSKSFLPQNNPTSIPSIKMVIPIKIFFSIIYPQIDQKGFSKAYYYPHHC